MELLVGLQIEGLGLYCIEETISKFMLLEFRKEFIFAYFISIASFKFGLPLQGLSHFLHHLS